MKNLIFAMNTHFKLANAGPSAEEQVALVKEAGFDGYYYTNCLKDPVECDEVYKATKAAGLKFAAGCMQLDVENAPTEEAIAKIDSVISKFSREVLVEFTIVRGGFGNCVGTSTEDGKILPWLKQIEPLLEKYGLRAALYPHFGFHLETLTEALDLLDELDSPHYGTAFTGYHWFRVEKEPNLGELLDRAGGRLLIANINGSGHVENEDDVVGGMNPGIFPLDEGTLDNAPVIAELNRVGFTGPIGVQGYAVNAPANEALMRSGKALKELLG